MLSDLWLFYHGGKKFVSRFFCLLFLFFEEVRDLMWVLANWPVGQTQPTTCFCIANWLEKNIRKISLSLKFYWVQPHSFLCVLILSVIHKVWHLPSSPINSPVNKQLSQYLSYCTGYQSSQTFLVIGAPSVWQAFFTVPLAKGITCLSHQVVRCKCDQNGRLCSVYEMSLCFSQNSKIFYRAPVTLL